MIPKENEKIYKGERKMTIGNVWYCALSCKKEFSIFSLFSLRIFSKDGGVPSEAKFYYFQLAILGFSFSIWRWWNGD